MVAKKYFSSLNSNMIAGDWQVPDATVCTVGVPTKIGEYTIKSGEKVQIGAGYAFVVPSTSAPARIEGEVNIYLMNSTGSEKHRVARFHTTECKTQGDKTQTKWLDALPYRGKKDSKFVIELTADATATLSLAKSIVNVPCIQFDVA